MYRLRIESCLLLGAALLASCSDRNMPTAPPARPVAAIVADHYYTWTVKCSGDGSSDASWVWAAAATGAALASGQGTCYPSTSPINGSGVRPGGADSLRACIWQFNNATAACQSWTFDPASAFSAQLKATSSQKYFCGSRRACTATKSATLNIDELTGSTTGDVLVTASTSGAQLDPDGYTVSVDGGAGQPLAVNGTVTFSGLSVGDHSVALSGIAANCVVSGANPVTVTVTSGTTTQTTFQIGCVQMSDMKIAFMTHRDGDWEIYLSKADGSNPFNVTKSPVFDAIPAWSPDGSKIAFQRDPVGLGFDIYLMNADGSGITRLTNNTDFDGLPAWSPDGSKIAFETDRDGKNVNYEVYVMNTDGTVLVNLTKAPGFDGWPAWSPDGSKIAFRSDRDGTNEVYVMNADGSAPRRLTTAGGMQPAWSPDGRKIAFVSDRDGNWEIYVMNADGSGIVRLTKNRAVDQSPAWSPDGSKIAFETNRSGDADIYVMNADGSGVINLTKTGSDEEHPAWRP